LCWQEANDSPSLALTQWERILSGPVDQVVAFMVERSERATRLRQSSRFAGILTEDERSAIFQSFRRESDPDFERDMKIARGIMKKRRNVFRQLAKK